MRSTALSVLALLGVVPLASPLAACQSGKADTTGQSTQGFFAASYKTLWDVTRRELNRAGFTADLEASDQANHVMVSRWNTHLAQFSMKGWREQATITLHPVEGRENYWSADANVIHQNNKNAKDPMNASVADWTPGERDAEKERRLVWGIEAFFLGGDVSANFRAKYGMPAGRAPVSPTPAVQPECEKKPRSYDPLSPK